MADDDREYRVPFRNAEGYPDPTTYGALNSVMRDYAAKQEGRQPLHLFDNNSQEDY